MSKPISNNEFDSLDAFFGDKLKDASMLPSDKVWQQIEGSLNKDRKRKRRFLWIFFSGMFLIGTTVATYFIFFDTKKSNTSPMTEVKNTSAVVKPTETNSTAVNNPIESKEPIKQVISESISKEENNKTVKIQIGAFKKQKDQAYFSKLNVEIKSETIQNGITRYYAEVPENKVQQTLEKIKQNGFPDAFIKEDNTPLNTAINTSVAKNNSAVKKEPVIAGIKNKQEGSIAIAKQKQSSNSSMVVNTNGVNIEQSDKTSTPSSNEATKTNALAGNQTQINQINDSNTKSNILNVVQTNTAVETSSKINDNVVLKDSVQKDTTLTQAVTIKKDSTLTKPDSVKTAKPVAVADSSNKSPILNRWALLLTGGSNFFLKNTQSNLFAASGEKQPSTYDVTLKVEFKPFKRLAFTGGVSYNYFIAQQDATAFSFNKNLTSDYIFYSSYGPMAVDKNTMLQGFNPAPWITTLHANYSYTSKINTLLVPVQAKYYYLNTKRINLFADMGFSGMMVLSQQTNLSIIKEHVTNNVSYNQITTTKFNGLLILGLGGDVRLYKQLYFTIDGGFRYGITNVSNTSGIKTSPAYFSANGGIKIKL